MPKRKMQGVVISTANKKTISVRVRKHKMHPKYRKSILFDKKYLAHDPEEKMSVGDVVTIEESRPISKMKKWIVLYNNPSA